VYIAKIPFPVPMNPVESNNWAEMIQKRGGKPLMEIQPSLMLLCAGSSDRAATKKRKRTVGEISYF